MSDALLALILLVVTLDYLEHSTWIADRRRKSVRALKSLRRRYKNYRRRKNHAT